MSEQRTAFTARDVRAFKDRLAAADFDGAEVTDADRIDLLRALEELAGAQAAVTADFDASQRAEQARRGVPAERRGREIASQVALARRESPHHGQRHLGLAKVLCYEMTHTMAALREGRITEWRATLVARETACLDVADRRRVDAELAAVPERIEAMGEGELVAEARKAAYRLDPASFVERRARAEEDRRVTVRPAPDVMTHLSALLPVKDGVAVFSALDQEAKRLKSAGDDRTRGQIMADTLVDRVLLKNIEGATAPRIVFDVVVPDTVLLGDSTAPGHLVGHGPVPADLVRELADTDQAWVRRLYAVPETGALVAMDSTARLMPARLAQHLLRVWDRTCRTPWCDAPVRHSDHAEAVVDGGATSATNGQGLCEACNHAKQAPGWRAGPSPGPRHTVTTTTPTGHSYDSTAPPTGTERWVQAGPGLWVLIA